MIIEEIEIGSLVLDPENEREHPDNLKDIKTRSNASDSRHRSLCSETLALCLRATVR